MESSMVVSTLHRVINVVLLSPGVRFEYDETLRKQHCFRENQLFSKARGKRKIAPTPVLDSTQAATMPSDNLFASCNPMPFPGGPC